MIDSNGVTRGLGRIPEPDARDREHLMRMVQPSEEEKPMVSQRVYRRGPILDQGRTGTCVAHAWRSWLDGEPMMSRGGPTPFELYDRFILADQWPENDHDTARQEGTSVRAGAKVLSGDGFVGRYLWAFNVDDVRRWVLTGQGGVVLGIDWHRDMGSPSPEGVIRTTGQVEGGHAIYLFGADDKQGVVYLQNSWSKEWGGWPHPVFKNVRNYLGCVKLPYDDLDGLLRSGGEACTAIQAKI